MNAPCWEVTFKLCCSVSYQPLWTFLLSLVSAEVWEEPDCQKDLGKMHNFAVYASLHWDRFLWQQDKKKDVAWSCPLVKSEVFFMFVTHHEKEKKNIISGSNADDTAKTSDLCYRSQNTDEGGIFKHENMLPNTHTKFLKKTRTENTGRDACWMKTTGKSLDYFKSGR